MKITTTQRREFDPKQFMGGSVLPETSFVGDARETPFYRSEIAKGLVIHNVWYELPDEPDGEYVLVESLHTNQYGYYEGRGSTVDLLTREQADTLDQRLSHGIENQLVIVKISGGEVECEYSKRDLVRKQGA